MSLFTISDVDECMDKNIRVNCKSKGAKCKNTDGSFECACPQGFKMHLSNHVCQGKVGWGKRTVTSAPVSLSSKRRESLGSRLREASVLTPGVSLGRSVPL